MRRYDRILKAFQRSLNAISDGELDQRIARIDAMDIKGPTTDEYFRDLTHSVGSFLDVPLESFDQAIIIDETEINSFRQAAKLFSDSLPEVKDEWCVDCELVENLLVNTVYAGAGETNYGMAA
jgi:hypothetical protein